jgi:hypothetical protein
LIIGCLSILNIEVYEPCKEQGQLKMDNTTKALLFLMLYVPPIIIGGIIAYKKGDFFSRGAAICAITWFFGLAFLVIAPKSKARLGDKEDLFSWHGHGANGGILFLACIVLFLLYRIFKGIMS